MYYAVQPNNGSALRYASKLNKNYKETISRPVKSNDMAIQYMPDDLKD